MLFFLLIILVSSKKEYFEFSLVSDRQISITPGHKMNIELTCDNIFSIGVFEDEIPIYADIGIYEYTGTFSAPKEEKNIYMVIANLNILFTVSCTLEYNEKLIWYYTFLIVFGSILALFISLILTVVPITLVCVIGRKRKFFRLKEEDIELSDSSVEL